MCMGMITSEKLQQKKVRCAKRCVKGIPWLCSHMSSWAKDGDSGLEAGRVYYQGGQMLMVSLQTLILLSVALLCLRYQHGCTQTSLRFADGVQTCTMVISSLHLHQTQLVQTVYTIPDLCSDNAYGHCLDNNCFV